MQVDYKFDTKHILDNEMAYFALLEGVIASVDQHCYIRIDKTPTQYLFRVSPTNVVSINSLISQINNLNNALHLQVDWGKSFKNTSNIFFTLHI